MPFRLSRQLFYILAAGCMCTWICITYIVVKNGAKSRRSDEDLYTQDGFYISDEYDVTDEPIQDVGNWSKNWNRNAFNREDTTPEILEEGETEKDEGQNEEGGENNDSVVNEEESENKGEKDVEEGSDEEQGFPAHVLEGKGNENEEDNDNAEDGEEEEGDEEDLKMGQAHFNDNENVNDIENKDTGGNMNIHAQMENNDKDQNKHNVNFQTDNIGERGFDKHDGLIKFQVRDEDSEKAVQNSAELYDNEENNNELLEMDGKGENDVEDTEEDEDEVDRAAKYRDFDDKNAHEYVLDDGEDDNDEDEDAVGDDNEHDDNFVKNGKDEIKPNAEVRVPDKILNDTRLEEVTLNYNAKGDVLQEIKNLPKVDSQNKAELKQNENVFNHGYQPFARLKEIEHNDKNLQNYTPEGALGLKDKETVKNENQHVETVKDKQKQDNDILNQYLKKGYDKIEEGKNKTIDNMKDSDLDIPVQDANKDNITNIKNAKIKVNFTNKGENGTGVTVDYEKMPAEEKQKMDKLYTVHDFNAYISDMISVNRTLPDIRSESCKEIDYDVNPATTDLPQTSVIIVFHNEARSVLLRSIYSVINRTPDYLLKEIILVDDFSTLAEDGKSLEKTISQISKAHLIRTSQHEGLIRARLIGAKLATAPVFTFLDAHVECFKGWLEPLLERLVEKADTVVCPQLQTISGSSFKIHVQDQLYVGTFQLSNLVFDWLPVQYMDKHLQSSDTDTVRTPVFAGGHFSIYRSYFYKIGSYDAGMNLWGAENLELSFRVWMCGGTVEIHPCSHVAHVYRQINPLEVTMKKAIDNAAIRNNLRTAAVWMDGFMKFYKEKGIENVDMGNITERLELRKQLECKSFQWYIDNVHPGLYVPGQALRLGEIRNSANDVCIDSGISVLSAHVSASKCRNRTSQFWHLSKLNALQREVGCVEYPKNISEDPRPTLERCDGGSPNQYWAYTKNGWLYNPQTHLCLGLTAEEKTLQLLKCESNDRFYWEWRNTGNENT